MWRELGLDEQVCITLGQAQVWSSCKCQGIDIACCCLVLTLGLQGPHNRSQCAWMAVNVEKLSIQGTGIDATMMEWIPG